MAEAIAGDAVSSTASGRLIAIETTKPSITVLSVANEWPSTVGPIAMRVVPDRARRRHEVGRHA